MSFRTINLFFLAAFLFSSNSHVMAMFGLPTQEEIKNLISEGIAEGMTAGVEGIKESINTDTIKEVLHEGIGDALKDGIGDGLHEGIANGFGDAATNIANNFSEAFKDNFAEGGAAREGLNNVFQSLGDQFNNENGQGRKAFSNFYKMNEDMFKEGGDGANAFKAFGDQVDSVGDRFRKLGDEFKQGANNLTTDMEYHALKFAGISVLGVAGIATAWYGSKVLWNYIERAIKRPVLINETSYKSWWQRIKNTLFGSDEGSKPLTFSPALEAELNRLITSTKRANKLITEGNKNIYYSNLLFYGPPGTGKTEFAKKLAKESGLEWVVISGSGFSQFSVEEGIAEIGKLFAWAKNQKNGLLIFIDEAETFLSKRENLNIDSREYKFLTTFLDKCGAQSNKFVIVYATNHPESLDDAVLSRTGEAIEFTTPGLQERIEIINNYAKLYLQNAYKKNAEILNSINTVMTPDMVAHIARQTDNCAPRDLAILMSNIAKDILKDEDGQLTPAIINAAIKRMREKKDNKFAAYGRKKATAAAAA